MSMPVVSLQCLASCLKRLALVPRMTGIWFGVLGPGQINAKTVMDSLGPVTSKIYFHVTKISVAVLTQTSYGQA